MEAVPLWQFLVLASIISWIFIASSLTLTVRLRSLIQPFLIHHVHKTTPFILKIQSFHHPFLDALFSGLSCIVSVPFYTAFLPLVFWSGHSKLARQMTLLIAFCDYAGSSIKDLISAPRPSSPPVRRVTATEDEKENALEYGLPSSHALNTVCLFGISFSMTSILIQVRPLCRYLLHYILSYTREIDGTIMLLEFTMVCLLVGLIGLGRIYLGMHSLIDVVGGVVIGSVILAVWLQVHEHIDAFIVSGQNVTSFWASLSFLLLFAYPIPELPTPSFEYHAAFDGVALGIVSGVQQTYLQFHHEDVPRIFSHQLPLTVYLGRILIGIPTILMVKFCCKALAKWLLPVVCNTLGIPVRSSCYIPAIKGAANSKNKWESKQLGYLQKMVFFSPGGSYDVDTGIRFVQYAGLAWSVVDLVPSVFSLLRL